ncbi:GlxA family transcriptional regulator [Vibrio tritonius]|uniref:GlxA family transcriptional regulator n=1 Tax=Vibrio tritonius TaxID=1435069 RepID=UPI0008392826|nr:helix-turn-helix domain-containing protein [Vibrio tritonius]
MSVLSVVVVATPGVSSFHLSIPFQVFGQPIDGQHYFDVQVCAEEPGIIQSEMGLFLEVEHGLELLRQSDIIIIPYWNHPEEKPNQLVLEEIRRAWHRGAEIVGLCLGAYVLAYAGLLDNHRAATHWEYEIDFRSRFPKVLLDNNSLYTSDERLITSAGTAAGIDCCLYIVRSHCGSSKANYLARRMVVPPYREGGQAQFIERPVPVNTRDEKINDLLDYLRRNLDKPHDLDTLAGFTNMSRRSFTRHFHKATGMTVSEWINIQRLQLSQELLETTSISIEKVSELAGFQSPVSFRQNFKTQYNVSPSEWRRAFRGPEPLS